MLRRVLAARGPLGARLVWWVGLLLSLYSTLPDVLQLVVFWVLLVVVARALLRRRSVRGQVPS